MTNTTLSNSTLDSFSSVSIIAMAFIFQQIVFAIVCFIGLLGNTLVIYVVLRFSKMQTVTNMYIVNLAIADECLLIGIPVIIATSVKKYWIFGGMMCKAYMTLTSINQYASSIFLFIMSADRYIAVCHPISSPRWRTPFISRVVSFCAWICSIILVSPILIYSTETEKIEEIDMENYTQKTCQVVWSNDESSDKFDKQSHFMATMFILYTFVFSFAIPLCLISIFYCLVLQKLRNVGPKNKSKEKRKSHRKVTNLVLTVVAVYVLCWLPYWIMQLTMIATQVTNPSSFVVTLNLLASCLSYSNSAVNPILYAFLSENFKKSFVKACTCAAGKEVNATLQFDNSVFPKKSRQENTKGRPSRATSLCPNTTGELANVMDPSTSKTNVTLTNDNKIKDTVIKNGLGTLSTTNNGAKL